MRRHTGRWNGRGRRGCWSLLECNAGDVMERHGHDGALEIVRVETPTTHGGRTYARYRRYGGGTVYTDLDRRDDWRRSPGAFTDNDPDRPGR